MKTHRLILSLVLVGASAMLPACKSASGPDDPVNLTFSGTITMGGSPLAGATVFLSGDQQKTTVTNGSGGFSFTGIDGEEFVVTPSLQNHAFTPPNYELGGESRTNLTFTAAAASYGSTVGQIAADFTAINQAGQPVSLYSYFGKVVLIDFSADWCGPCRSEAATAEALYQSYKSQGFEMLTILISGSTSAWATEYGLTFSVLDDTLESLWGIYGEGYIPLNIVLDRNMTIRYKEAGYSESAIVVQLKKYL